MRYAVILRGLTLDEAKRKCQTYGAREILVLQAIRQVTCELDDDAFRRMALEPGLIVKPLSNVQTANIKVPMAVGASSESGYRVRDFFAPLLQALNPPLTGQGLTVAVLDSGVRQTHIDLVDKVVYSASYVPGEGAEDQFNHGTTVAFVVLEASPGAAIIDIKVIDKTGVGNAEGVVAGIDEVCRLVELARSKNLPLTDPMYPNVINMSFGAEDEGDPNEPMRVAARTAVEEYGLDVIAAAGNTGPGMSTVLSPAVDSKVLAVGGVRSDEFTVWENSGRGPTNGAIIKPDVVYWATDILGASAENDNAYVSKSGTSFAAPVASGAIGPVWEVVRRVYGQNYRALWNDILPAIPAYCIKPESAPLSKDNSYGYGLLAMGPMVTKILRQSSSTDITGMMMPMMGLGMFAMMTMGLMRGFRNA